MDLYFCLVGIILRNNLQKGKIESQLIKIMQFQQKGPNALQDTLKTLGDI